jgi:Met-zincin/Domain of unknown function (DUF5117)
MLILSEDAAMTRFLLVVLCLTTSVGLPSAAADDSSAKSSRLPSVAEKTAGLQRVDGFLPFYLDHDQGTILAELPDQDHDFLYATGLSSGLGSNPVGLDRGQWGKTRSVHFVRVGRRVFLIEQNLKYRAAGHDSAEREAVADSFADSVFWSGDVTAVTDEVVLVDIRSLLLRDANDVISRLKSTKQGDYSFDRNRSFIELNLCKSFPDNSELNAMVTFVSAKPGSLVRDTAADGRSFSLRLHHSFVKLPDAGYTPRKADPRVASLAISFADYSAPLDRPLEQRWIARHRLQKSNPKLEKSPAVEPIVYYLDPGTPQPVRDALLDGARWWTEAFEAAGFVDAFQVRILPDDVDPMDVRYNVIQWVHRSTRGWSYGQSITDPRTGEIIKGHVLLGSLRVRQDRMIIDGLTSISQPPANGICSCCGLAGAGFDSSLALFDPSTTPIDVSLARLRQLSAHEVGHTIGFSHNFAASTYSDRASVMDYPAPRVKLTDDGAFDLSDAYGVGVGIWDTFMVRYAYTEFPDKVAEEKGLQDLLEEAAARRMLFLSDADARPDGAASPLANLWDNGSDPVEELSHLMRIRRIALKKLSDTDLLETQNLSDLEVVLVPIYFYHRYQIDAVAKLIGGFDYDYAVPGEQGKLVTPIPVARQEQALAALMHCLEPAELQVPDRLLPMMAPRPWHSATDRERFQSRTAMIFDPDSVARVAAEHTLSRILQPERAARLQAYGTDDWNLATVLDHLSARIVTPAVGNESDHVNRITQYVYVRQLIGLAGDESTSHAVRADANDQLRQITIRLNSTARDVKQQSHARQLLAEISRFTQRPHVTANSSQIIEPPPGSPIGSDDATR